MRDVLTTKYKIGDSSARDMLESCGLNDQTVCWIKSYRIENEAEFERLEQLSRLAMTSHAVAGAIIQSDGTEVQVNTKDGVKRLSDVQYPSQCTLALFKKKSNKSLSSMAPVAPVRRMVINAMKSPIDQSVNSTLEAIVSALKETVKIAEGA